MVATSKTWLMKLVDTVLTDDDLPDATTSNDDVMSYIQKTVVSPAMGHQVACPPSTSN